MKHGRRRCDWGVTLGRAPAQRDFLKLRRGGCPLGQSDGDRFGFGQAHPVLRAQEVIVEHMFGAQQLVVAVEA